MSISYKDKTLHIPTWRAALAKLSSDVKKELDELCYGDELGLAIPTVIPDDWSDETRGYSWTKNDPNRFGLQHSRTLWCRMLKDRNLKPVQIVNGRLQLNHASMKAILARCDQLCEKLFLLVFLTPGPPPRVSEIADYKHANSTRGRSMCFHDCALWLINRRVKSESLLRKESSNCSKASQVVTEALQKYFLLVRPLEMEIAYHVLDDSDRTEALQLYGEYMWLQSGKRMSPKDLCHSIRTFLSGECNMDAGPRTYRQICVEIIRVFLGSEAEAKAEERDLMAAQMGHSLELGRSAYAGEAGHLRGMSSDLLLRYGRASEGWWGVIGFKTGSPPLEPLRIRQQLAAEAAANATAKQHENTESLLSIAALLRKEVERLEAPAQGVPTEG